MANLEKAFEAFTPRPTDSRRAKSVLFNASSGDSTDAVGEQDEEIGALAGMFERLDPTSPHRHSVLRKPGSKKCILVDEIDEECVSMKGIPKGFTRGRSASKAFETQDDEQQHRARTRSVSRFRGYGREEEDKIIRRVRERSVSRGIRLSWNMMTNEEYSEMSSAELAKRICPESFNRFRRVGPNGEENPSQNVDERGAKGDTHASEKHMKWKEGGRKSRDDFDLRLVSEVYRAKSITCEDSDDNKQNGVSKDLNKQRRSRSAIP